MCWAWHQNETDIVTFKITVVQIVYTNLRGQKEQFSRLQQCYQYGDKERKKMEGDKEKIEEKEVEENKEIQGGERTHSEKLGSKIHRRSCDS